MLDHVIFSWSGETQSDIDTDGKLKQQSFNYLCYKLIY